MDRNNIYRVDRKLEKRLEQLEAAEKISEEGKTALRRFIEDLASQSISEHRQLSYLDHLLPFARDVGEAFLVPTKSQVKKAVARIERSGLSEWSKVNKKVAIKRFYKWHLGEDEKYPASVAWIKTTIAQSKRKLPEDLLSKDEIRAVLEGAISPRDKALISLLADGGLRIGEVLGLRVKDFHPDEYGGYLMVQGKTGPRRVRLIESVPYAAAWLRAHPGRDDPDDPLFIKLGQDRGKALPYHAARKTIREAARRGGVDLSKVNPHNFRHSAATRLAKDVPEMPLEAQMGWVPGSKMAKVYVHLSGRDQDEAILKAHGIDINGDTKPDREAPQRCPRCREFNEAKARFCQVCGMALSPEAASQVEDLEARIDALVEKKLREMLSQAE